MHVLLATLAVLGATVYETTFEAGVAAYDAKDYAGAIAKFEQLAESGVQSPDLYFDLANAYHDAGQLGAAVANYERVLKFDPSHDAARANLQTCLQETERSLARPDPSPYLPALFFWHGTFSTRETELLAIAMWAVFWLLLIVRLWRPWPLVRITAGFVLAFALLFSAAVWVKVRPEPLAVALPQSVPVRVSTSEDATVRFELHAGDRVLLEEESEGWARLRTAGDERGWVPRTALMRVWPFEPAPAETPPAG